MKRFERDFKGKLFQKFSLKRDTGDPSGRPYNPCFIRISERHIRSNPDISHEKTEESNERDLPR